MSIQIDKTVETFTPDFMASWKESDPVASALDRVHGTLQTRNDITEDREALPYAADIPVMEVWRMCKLEEQ